MFAGIWRLGKKEGQDNQRINCPQLAASIQTGFRLILLEVACLLKPRPVWERKSNGTAVEAIAAALAGRATTLRLVSGSDDPPWNRVHPVFFR